MLSDQFEQLPMFMSAREIHRNFAPGDRGGEIGPHADARIWNKKLQEAKDEGLESSVRQQGVQKPVDLELAGQSVLNGHHRIAAAVHTGADQLVPVLHHENFKSYINNGWNIDRAWPGQYR
jgi:hypothetical protein